MIKFLDLKAVNRRYESDIREAFSRVLESGWYLFGKELEVFEVEFAEYCGTRHAVGVASGLDALSLIIQAYGFGPGDEIIVPANTYIATVMPAAIGKNKEVEEIFSQYGTIVYRRDVFLNWNGAVNFIKQIYKEDSWIGNFNNQFAGAQYKARCCFPQNDKTKTQSNAYGNFEVSQVNVILTRNAPSSKYSFLSF